MAELNLFKAYISAWSNYEEDKFIDYLRYIDKYLTDNHWSEWFDIKYFDKYFSIHRGDYYDVDSPYAIGNNKGQVVWSGDYPTEDVLRFVINNCE